MSQKRAPLKLYDKEGQVECGVDEAGRGALCGRVYTAAVVLPEASSFGDEIYLQIRDSKQLSEKKREMLCTYIENHALAYAVTFSEAEEIDSMNILQATIQSMQRAIHQVDKEVSISKVFIDGSYWKDIYREEDENGSKSIIDATTVIDGDKTYMHIAAASILAKVYRDRYMTELAKKNPEWETRYKWSKNKGYGTADHTSGIKKYGITSLHRKSFAPCKNFV
jgi:ribonuclease HII